MSLQDPHIHLVLAEYASLNRADGTVSVIRGWITNWTAAAIPQLIGLHLVADLRNVGKPSEKYDFSLEIVAPSGLRVGMAAGELIMSSSGPSQFTFPLSFQIVEHGNYKIEFVCDGVVGAVLLDVRAPRDETKEKP